MSPYLVAERTAVRGRVTAGVAHRMAQGETPLAAWRVESTMTIRRLDRLTGIPGSRLIEIETGAVAATRDELLALAQALRLDPALLASMLVA